MNEELEYILNQIRERRAVLVEAMTHDNCKSHDEYRYMCGQIRGLNTAYDVVADLKQRMEEFND